MAKNTMLSLRRYPENIALDYKKAMDVWTIILSDQRDQSVEDLAQSINDHLKTFSEVNSTGTWEDAMIWSVFLYHYDAQTGLLYESGFQLQKITNALAISECSDYAKRTSDYAYYILHDKKI